jgi:hypothetical protein
LGFREQLTGIDPDIIEKVNVPLQVYKEEEEGAYKASKVTRNEGNSTIVGTDECLPTFPASAVIVLATDNIVSRRRIYEKAPLSAVIVDGRMAGQYYEVWICRKWKSKDVKRYEESFFDPSEATAMPCGEQGIVYCFMSAAAEMVADVKRIFNKEWSVMNHFLSLDMLTGERITYPL